ncbi:ABC transporter ATP-binding protein [Glaciibacter psychrotolerans]|uniref:Sulfonate transport system ATP-binding protein n=1 Tax=Glaciibacter psychrotolerans TaxID=670054 RepID=A0A7Z0EGS4_9MICO|nr:ABC transporter ATP-binding protein [Leifsonia psychrotolerans]NYJ21223.1 sulfonate transport system ATP-binding protein [Leifsonia psychrotolerans]
MPSVTATLPRVDQRAEVRADSPSVPPVAPRENSSFSVTFDGIGRVFGTDGARGASAGPRAVLGDVSLTVPAGEILAILGTSGCGKSTLLRIAGGLDTPSSGTVTIDGTSVRGIDPRCAVGFQEPRLLPWRTLAANVALGLPRGTPRASGRAHVRELLELVGLTAFAQHRPREVSGGMAQRASLARALARNPGVLLLDEPFGALDALTRLKMQDLLLDVHQAAPTTVLLVTHDVDEALQLADRIILLGRSDGERSAGIRHEIVVPGARPRDRGSAELAELRAELLAGLGVDRHRGAASRFP